ncbi:phage major capsid protein [Clostridium sp.]|uniref:phage major capsid protein n=1 Tax=Clostridium sp. TaxID=1506 RepID=UPI002FC68A13
MSNLKSLRDKKNQLINELEEMVSLVEAEETRSLTKEELDAFDVKKAEIENIEATLARVEEIRAKNMGTAAVQNLEETRSNDAIEKRALENFFRGIDLDADEKRALSSTGNTALIPVTISKSIMQRLEEQCPILAMATKYSTKGVLRLIDESDIGQAAITAENAAFPNAEVTFKNIELRSWKVSTSVAITFEMLANSEIDLSKYLVEVIIRRLSKELNRLYLIGTGTNQPQGLVNGTQTVTLSDASALSINDFITMQTSINPAYINESTAWIVNRETYTKMGNLLDGQGRPYLTANVIGDGIQYRFLGSKVIVDSNMPSHGTSGNKSIIYANIRECYSINMVQEITTKHLVEKGFTNGIEEFAAYVLTDGKLHNNDACVVGVSK